ncbi:MAG: hypothetical protein AAF581_09320 [Planctomycetota bacterium]
MKIALALFVMLVAGIGIGYVAGSADPAPPLDSATEVATPSAEPDVEAAQSSVTPGVDQSETESSESPPQLLVSALDEIPDADYRPGDGTIHGTVTTVDGAPLVGVEVSAVPTQTMLPLPRYDYDQDSLEELVVRYVKRTRFRRRATGMAITGEDGAYRIAGLADDGEFRVLAQKDGWQFEMTQGSSIGVVPGDVVDFRASKVVKVPVSVVFADGRVAKSARLSVRSPGKSGRRSASRRWHVDEPQIELRPGTYTLSAEDSLEKRQESDEVEIVVAAGAVSEPVRLVLREQPGIRGRVLFPDGEAADNAVVKWLRSRSGQAASPLQLAECDNSEHASSFRQFRFECTKLEPGTYTVGVQRSWSSPVVAVQLVVVSEGMVEIELAIPPLKREEYLQLAVRGPDGELRTDCSYSIRYKMPDGGTHGTNAQVVDQPAGIQWVVLAPPDGVAIADLKGLTLTIDAEGLGKRTLEWSPGDPLEYDVTFQPPAELTIQIAGYAGSEYADRLRLNVSQAGSARSSRTFRSSGAPSLDDEGVQVFGPLEPGEYIVSLSASLGRYESRNIAEISVSVNSGANQAVIALPPLYVLTVRTTLDQGSELRIQEVGKRTFNRPLKVDADGVVRFEMLAAGDYLIIDRTSGMPEQMQVSVPAQLDIQYNPQQPNAVAVQITDREGTLAQAGLQDGDILVGAAGETFTDVLHMMGIVQKAVAAGESVVFEVQRGQQRLQVELEAKAFMGGPQTGGDLQPVRWES